jgi:hypothetical protein
MERRSSHRVSGSGLTSTEEGCRWDARHVLCMHGFICVCMCLFVCVTYDYELAWVGLIRRGAYWTVNLQVHACGACCIYASACMWCVLDCILASACMCVPYIFAVCYGLS